MTGHNLRVEPVGVTISVAPGQTILDAAQLGGLHWPTVCNGGGTCMTCHFIIRAGKEHFTSQPETENCRKALNMIRKRYSDVPPDHVRLACQTTLSGDGIATCQKARVAS